jgi:hypothetical protein
LREQAISVVEALYEWSGFAKKATLGLIASSWASQFVNVYERFGGQALALPVIESFFIGDDDIAKMQPKIHPVTLGDVTHSINVAPVAADITCWVWMRKDKTGLRNHGPKTKTTLLLTAFTPSRF